MYIDEMLLNDVMTGNNLTAPGRLRKTFEDATMALEGQRNWI